MTFELIFFQTVLQLYRKNDKVIAKCCRQGNPIFSGEKTPASMNPYPNFSDHTLSNLANKASGNNKCRLKKKPRRFGTCGTAM